MDRKAKGIQGEERAGQYYESFGGEILETNYRVRRCEIDLIVLLNDELLVFAEVKMRSRSDYGEAETFMSDAQQERIREAAEEYIFGINWKRDIRFDIVTVDQKGQIEIFEDAF